VEGYDVTSNLFTGRGMKRGCETGYRLGQPSNDLHEQL
jgi:hypothetical protein